MNPQERLEKLENLIHELVQQNEEIPVIVEGRKDERTLRELGLKGELLRLNKGVSIFSMCESLSRRYDSVILMTDWDRRGGQLAKLLREGLEANGVQFEDKFREKIAALTKRDIKDVESLAKHLSRLRRIAERGVGGFI
ncbi:MAG: hypothetical protein KAW09_11655 [Thermoplasmata archaeon]|nr:hypothetical protein [Thermoplasmata archaeon]